MACCLLHNLCLHQCDTWGTFQRNSSQRYINILPLAPKVQQRDVESEMNLLLMSLHVTIYICLPCMHYIFQHIMFGLQTNLGVEVIASTLYSFGK
uniref:Uncharacterized protein n=1 Tax=Pyxicephalus adspersus TaxID=30357 RepID=A0AAV2ZYG1_PYXAD|nr:TPA: hypothetical protein GDO54_002636 [Pyxicephalus adspersus]